MAGYDFEVEVRNVAEDSVIRRVLHGLQLRCRKSSVQVRYRRTTTGYRVTVDGSLIAIQASRSPIAIALGAIADAAHDLGIPRRRRLQIGHRVLRGYLRGAWEATELVLDVANSYGMAPGSFVFDSVSDPVVQYRLDSLTEMLQSWAYEEATTEQTLEELHAVAELSMGYVLGDRWDDRSFAEQAAEMVRRGHLGQPHHDALIALKDRRRDVRHHRGQMRRDEFRDRLTHVLPVIHRIVRLLQASRP